MLQYIYHGIIIRDIYAHGMLGQLNRFGTRWSIHGFISHNVRSENARCSPCLDHVCGRGRGHTVKITISRTARPTPPCTDRPSGPTSDHPVGALTACSGGT